MPLGDTYNNPANWVRKHFIRDEKHHYEHPKIVMNRKRSHEELQLHPSNSSVTSFPGQGVKLLSKMPTAESLMSPSDNEHSMDDEDNNDQELYGGSRKSTTETKRWDVFRVIPIEDSNLGNQRCLELTIRILKVIAYIVTFLLVLGAGVVAKGTYLFMSSQIKANHTRVICRNDGDRNHQYHAEIPIRERIAWIWCLAFAFIVPEFFTFFRSLRICVFKSYHKPPIGDFLVVLFFETGHVIGISLFTFAVLPELDAVKGAMLTNCVGLFPAILAVLSRHNEEPKRIVKIFIDILAILAQATGLVVWPLVDRKTLTYPWAIPVSIFLISLGWWENYVDKRSPLGIIQRLAKVKSNLYNKTRYFTYAVMAIWKTLVFVTSLLVFYHITEDIAMDLIDNFRKSFGENDIPLKLNTAQQNDMTTDFNSQDKFEESEKSFPYTSISVFVIQMSSALIAYVVGKFACRICIQGFSYAFPVNLTIPVTISLLIAACGVRMESPCFLTSIIPKYLYWDCAQGDFFETFLTREHNWVWLLWLLSQTWITLHIWTPKCERLANTEKLFVTPMYNGLLVDQSLGLNRRRDEEGELKADGMDIENNLDDNEMSQFYETISNTSDSSEAGTPNHPDKTKKSNVLPTDMITRIYACATMWHETSDEMIAMLKSIFRMDEDQCARRNAQKYLHIIDPDFYEFETHVFFDDAFEISDDNEDENVVNRFVKLMIQVMDEAASNVHQTNIKIRPPKKVPTPYGGRLVWTLPGKTKLIAHLKDKSKIRHRKRWSQVMYMYYLLGHKLMELDIHPDRKEVMAENTYLLTLDGDIDFQPQAVALLVDLMKKNRNLGAACGRIHPIGSGPMVWYQKFEYAIGHWLQKATEHMIGCVLCSPGCFSLFRAKGLMDDNVMRRYTTRSDEARHYVQYDQGEDRWLCTLLLQRGYRVEYSAASDAYTHCPEGFGEFYNQRRRWVPSTIANILDLLMDANRTIKVNDNISRPYIWYQGMLMAGTILGPGTIFLMLVGAFVAAFKIDNWTSFGANIVPILLFMFICFVAKPDHQLLFAEILSALYALIMMAVLVGISLQMKEDGIGSPSFIFIIALSGSFFIAACLHPQEFWCIVPGLIYYLSIPSMYLLLIIYSLINLNIVSWGTREVQTKKTKQVVIAEVLSAFYTLVMMAVIVGTLLQIQEDGWTSPGTIFLMAITFTFVVSALLHPLEIMCLVQGGWLYYLLVPSMYLLLMIYSSINMNNVNWGTRETLTKKTKQELLEEKKQEEEMKKKQKSGAIFQFLGIKEPEELEGGFTVHLANLCSFMLCTAPKPKMEQLEIMKMNETLNKLNEKLNRIEEIIEITHNPGGLPRRKSMSRGSLRSGMAENLVTLAEGDENDSDDMSVSESSESRSLEHKIERDDLTNPYWIEDKDLKKGAVEYLPEQEIAFWKELLEKYLHPIDSNKDHQARVVSELKELRNKAVFAFFMFNALFILIVFLLQLNKDNLYVEWPLGVKTNVTYIEESNEIRVSKEYLHLEPIGLVFVFFFALIITIQFVAMLFHRFGTLSHILASTELNCFRSKEVDNTGDAFIDKHAVQIARDLQRLKGLNETKQPMRRNTVIHELDRSHKQNKQIGTLDVAFRKRFFSISDTKPIQDTPILSGIQRLNMPTETIKALAVRRDTAYNSEPKRNRMMTLGAKNSIVSQTNRHRSNGRLSNVFPPSNDVLSGIDNKGFRQENDDDVYVTSRSSISGVNKVAAWNDPEERSASQL